MYCFQREYRWQEKHVKLLTAIVRTVFMQKFYNSGNEKSFL
jgi:uncharacterized protein with ParB-like and HNH nuclease domain